MREHVCIQEGDRMRYLTPALNYARMSLFDHLQIEPTTRCNLACPTCIHKDGVPIVDIMPSTLNAILRNHPNTALVTLQGLGEPLMHPEFEIICQIAKKRVKHVQTCTNGTLWNDEAIEYLSHVTVSLDTINPVIAEKIKGRGYNLGEVLTNILRYKKLLPVEVNFTQTAYSYAELPYVADWCNTNSIPLNVTRVQNWYARDEPGWQQAHDEITKERRLFGQMALEKPLCQWRRFRWYYYRADGHRNPCCRRMAYREYNGGCCDTCPD